MDTLDAALAYSVNLGERWVQSQALARAEAEVLALADSLEPPAPVPAARYGTPEYVAHWRAGSAARALRAAVSVTGNRKWYCDPVHLEEEGVPCAGARLVAALVAAAAMEPTSMAAPAPPAGPCRWHEEAQVIPLDTPAVPAGWRVACLSGAPHTAFYTWRYIWQGLPVVDVCEDGGVHWHARAEAKVLRAARKAKAAAHHAAYLADLTKARAAVAADPNLRARLSRPLEPSTTDSGLRQPAEGQNPSHSERLGVTMRGAPRQAEALISFDRSM